MICALSSITMPRISARVVCTLRETIVTLEPTSALTSVDLPTFGAPISATKPQRVAAGAARRMSSVIIDAFARDHRGAATFSAARLLPPTPSAGQARQFDCDAELRIVMRPVRSTSRYTGSAGLCPAPIPAARSWDPHGRTACACALSQLRCMNSAAARIAAVEEDRTDHGFADVAEHGFRNRAPAPAPPSRA